jgi:hypothetical protein
LAGTIFLVGRQYGLPSEVFWANITKRHSYALILLISIVGIFGILTPCETLSNRARLERGVALRRQILTTFGQLLDIGKSVHPPLEVSDLGLHVWRKKRTLGHPTHGVLTRVATYRLGSTPVTRPLRPTRGVGVVGLCWLLDREVGEDVAGLAAQLTDERKFTAYQEQHGTAAVMGFSWEEFRRFSHRGAVFASPIRNGRSSFIGCISFDVAHGYEVMNCHRMWHEINALCLVLGQDGFKDV